MDEREREISGPLVHSPDSPKCQSYARSKPGNSSGWPTQVQVPSTWAAFLCFPRPSAVN